MVVQLCDADRQSVRIRVVGATTKCNVGGDGAERKIRLELSGSSTR
jgi:hypothetical protein